MRLKPSLTEPHTNTPYARWAAKQGLTVAPLTRRPPGFADYLETQMCRMKRTLAYNAKVRNTLKKLQRLSPKGHQALGEYLRHYAKLDLDPERDEVLKRLKKHVQGPALEAADWLLGELEAAHPQAKAEVARHYRPKGRGFAR